jgi:chemotaxis protein histidine kinase CheA
MTEQKPAVRKFAPTNRLAEMIGLPGGKTVRDAVQDAEAAVEEHRPEVLADIDAQIAALERLAAQPEPEAQALYRISAGIIEHAGMFGLAHVGEAAFSLCELIDRMELRGQWDRASVDVHVASIRLLQGLGDDEAGQREHLLRGLKAVTAKAAPARQQPRAE